MHCLLDDASDMRACMTPLEIVFRISALGASILYGTSRRAIVLTSRALASQQLGRFGSSCGLA